MRGGAGGDEGGGDGASTNLPIAPRDASDGRVTGLVIYITAYKGKAQQNIFPQRRDTYLDRPKGLEWLRREA